MLWSLYCVGKPSNTLVTPRYRASVDSPPTHGRQLRGLPHHTPVVAGTVHRGGAALPLACSCLQARGGGTQHAYGRMGAKAGHGTHVTSPLPPV